MRVRGERGTGPGIYESFHREVHLSGMYEYIRIYIHVCTPHSRLFQRLRAPRQLVRRPAGPGERFAGNPDKLFWYIKLSDPHRDDDDRTVTHTQQRRGLVRPSFSGRLYFIVHSTSVFPRYKNKYNTMVGVRACVRPLLSTYRVTTANNSWTAVFIDRTLLRTRFTYE